LFILIILCIYFTTNPRHLSHERTNTASSTYPHTLWDAKKLLHYHGQIWRS